MITAQVLDPRVDPEPADWPDFVARQQLHPVWDYQLMRLESWLTRNPPLLVIVRDEKLAVAAVSAMVCRPWREPRYAPPPNARTRRLLPRWVEVCVPWVSGHPAYAFDAGLDLPGRRAARRAVERGLARHLGAGLLGVLHRPIGADLIPVFGGRGRLVQRIDTTAILRNRWSTVDEWLASLGHGRRKSLRKAARRIEADRTLEVEFAPGRTDLDPHELATMLDRHRKRLGVSVFDRRTPASGVYLDVLVRRPDVHTLTYRDDGGRLLAFSTLLDHPVSPILQLWATRPIGDGGRPNLYFDCYFRGIRHLIENGRSELRAGRGLQDVKATLGFAPHALASVGVPRPLIGR